MKGEEEFMCIGYSPFAPPNPLSYFLYTSALYVRTVVYQLNQWANLPSASWFDLVNRRYQKKFEKTGE